MLLLLLVLLPTVFAATVTQVEVIQVFVPPTSAAPPSNPTTSSSSIDSASQFVSNILDFHNNFRSLHNSQPLHWNSTVAQYASDYASKYDCSGQLVHSHGSYGENLAIGYSTSGAVNAWYEEGNSYIYGTESTYNHFTALVWNSTYSVGCSSKHCNSVWGTYIICSYYPAGNVIGQSTKNIFPPGLAS